MRAFTFADYLRNEQDLATKHEYFFGEMIAIADGSARHALVAANVAGELRSRLTGTPCRVFSADLRLAINPPGMAVYPDVTVFCGRPRAIPEHWHTFDNPALVVEVLSPSTRLYDTGAKAEAYQGVDSLREFLLIDPRPVLIEHWTRPEAGRWIVDRITRPDAELRLLSLGVTLPVAEIYRDAETVDD